MTRPSGIWIVIAVATITGACAGDTEQYTPKNATNVPDLRCGDYKINVIAGAPGWTPRSGDVCVAGTKTVIRFPIAMRAREAPDLFLLSGGDAHMVNYQSINGRYIIQSVIDRAELRRGWGDEAEVVGIAPAAKRR